MSHRSVQRQGIDRSGRCCFAEIMSTCAANEICLCVRASTPSNTFSLSFSRVVICLRLPKYNTSNPTARTFFLSLPPPPFSWLKKAFFSLSLDVLFLLCLDSRRTVVPAFVGNGNFQPMKPVGIFLCLALAILPGEAVSSSLTGQLLASPPRSLVSPSEHELRFVLGDGGWPTDGPIENVQHRSMAPPL